MKEFRFIEIKDPYENISPNNLIVKRYDGINRLITYSRYSFIGFLIIECIFKTPLYEILENSGVVGTVVMGGVIIFLVVALPGIFIGLFLWLLGFVKFIYNLINKKIIGVDLYSDIVNFLDDFAYKLNEMDKEDDDEDYEDDIIENKR